MPYLTGRGTVWSQRSVRFVSRSGAAPIGVAQRRAQRAPTIVCARRNRSRNFVAENFTATAKNPPNLRNVRNPPRHVTQR